jgi:hypothetical protein
MRAVADSDDRAVARRAISALGAAAVAFSTAAEASRMGNLVPMLGV